MQQMIKQEGPYRQLLVTVNFAFMKIFDFLVKIAIFGAFLFQSRDSHLKQGPTWLRKSGGAIT